MPHTARPSAADSGADTDGYAVRSAPYALARASVLHQPAQSPAAAAFRTQLACLAALEAQVAALLPQLGEDLYASRSTHQQAFHRDVVLPLRRALHNGREPRPALLSRLGDLPARVPRLAAWLALRGRRSALLSALDGSGATALAAERAALAALCREPAFARAIALTSPDLLRAVERAATGADDRRARKEEPSVLRYALRASTKTSPLSWFTAVGWGPLTELAPPRATPHWGEAGLLTEPLTAVVKANRTLVSALSQALLDDPRRSARLPHRMTSTGQISGGRAAYARSRVVLADGSYLVTDEDEVELAASEPLELVAALCEPPAALAPLADRLDAALGAARGGPATAAFLVQLTSAGLLVPTDPVDPQDDNPLAHLARWLRTRPEDRGPAERIEEIARRTAEFATTAPARRPALLTELASCWGAVLAEAGRPLPPDVAPAVLFEDVVAPLPLRLDGLLGPADHQALGELTALAEVFDLGHLVRRITRDRFVARYGPGGVCRHPWEFGAEVALCWQEAGRLAALLPGEQGELPTGGTELAALRATVVAAVGEAVRRDGAHGAAADLVLPVDLVAGLGDRLPRWALERPLSYSYFLQRDSADGLLCVNHVYGGWGRFSSRFLDALDPAAAAAVARQIHRGLGERAKAAQVRPVGGFNANLHPLLVADEIGPDRRWASIGESELDLVHDESSDQVRLRLRATGELLDVLYDGFLAPILLPQRIAPFLSDHPHGVVDFRALVPRHTCQAPGGQVVRLPRLRHRHVVLDRRRWQLAAGVVRELRAELAADRPVPAATAARWRTLLDLPEQLFLHAAEAGPADRQSSHLPAPKPQFVDLGNALHLRSLGKWLSRHPDGAVFEEALPAPGGRDRPHQAVELVLETYRTGRPS